MALPDKATSAGYDVQAQTNHLSHFLLTSELMPALKAAAAGSAGEARVVSHSSISRKSPGTALQEKYFGKNGGNLGGDSVGARYERYHQVSFPFTLQSCGLVEEASSWCSLRFSWTAVDGLSVCECGDCPRILSAALS